MMMAVHCDGSTWGQGQSDSDIFDRFRTALDHIFSHLSHPCLASRIRSSHFSAVTHRITAISTAGDYIITGDENGDLVLRDLLTPKVVQSLALQLPIQVRLKSRESTLTAKS